MRIKRPALACLAAALALAACAPAPQAPVASPSPTASVVAAPGGPAPSAGAPTAAPTSSSAPTVAPATASPTASPAAATPAPAAFDLTQGKLLRKYDFQGISGVHYDFSRDQLWVVDGEDEDESPRRYLARRFKRDGTFDTVIALNKENEQAPEAVDGFAFDLSGVPAFTYRFDDAFNLRRLYTATVEDATRLPGTSLERAGVAALAAEGDVFSLGVIRLDPDATEDYDTTNREILFVRAEEDEDPEAIFRIKDPMEPTSRLAMAPEGVLYMFGGIPGVGLRVKRLDKTQTVTDLPIPLSRMPDRVWVAPNGDLLLLDETTGNVPAKLRRFTSAGQLVAESEVKLADGQVVYRVDGLTFDGRGHIVIVGSAIAPNLVTTTGLFDFD